MSRATDHYLCKPLKPVQVNKHTFSHLAKHVGEDGSSVFWIPDRVGEAIEYADQVITVLPDSQQKESGVPRT